MGGEVKINRPGPNSDGEIMSSWTSSVYGISYTDLQTTVLFGYYYNRRSPFAGGLLYDAIVLHFS